MILWLWATLRLSAQMSIFQPVDLREVGPLHVSAFCQDEQGWLWVGAQEGLFLYDGHSFRRARLPRAASARITALSWWDGRLWVGFADGTVLYSGQVVYFQRVWEDTAQWHVLLPEEARPRKAISGFAAGPTGQLWISTDGEGLYYCDRQQPYRVSRVGDKLRNSTLSAVCIDLREHLWVATDAGLFSAPASTPEQMVSIGGMPDLLTTALTKDIQGNIWIGTHEKGICRYRIEHRQLEILTPNWAYGPVTCVVVLGAEEAWVGTEDHGLVRVDIATGTCQAFSPGHPLGRGRIRSLFKDREGLLWVASDRSGLWMAHGRIGLLEAPVAQPMAVLVDAQGRLWVGGAEGLFVRKGGVFRPVAPVVVRHVTALWASVDTPLLWVGTFDRGVFLLTPEGRVVRRLTRAHGLPDDNVLAIAGDDKYTWLATFAGVVRVDRRNLECSIVKGVRAGYIYAVLIDRLRRVWLGTQGDGLFCFDGDTLYHYTPNHHAALRTVYSIAEDRYGNLWFSGERGTLLRLASDGSFRTHSSGGIHNAAALIIALKANADGLLVVGRDDGFYWLSPQPQGTATCPITIDLPPMSVGLNAACTDRKGHVWIGTTRGIWRIAALGEATTSAPIPVITSCVSLAQNKMLSTSQLSYGDNYLEFTFDAIWYTQHRGLSFRYRLEGIDLDWKLSQDHQAHYSRLPPGHYTFRIQASRCGSFEHAAEARWSFSIAPPFWRRWWFQGLAGLLAIGALYSWIRWREQRLKREAHQRRQLAEAQLEALRAQINPHFLFNSFSTLSAIIEENASMAVEYVHRLTEFYRNLLATQTRDYVSLQEEREHVQHYAFLLSLRYGKGFLLEDRIGHLSGLVPPFSLQILVENAVKHNVVSVNRPLKVELFVTEDGYIAVRNNLQRRVAAAPGIRLGLQNLIRRFRLLGQPPVIVEETERYFTVRIPLKSTHL